MQKHRALVLLTVLVAAAAWIPISVDAQKGKPKPTATEVRSTFRDAPSDAISSDGYGLVFYETNETTKTQNVLTETSAANYILDPFTATRGTGVRCVDLNLASVIALAPEQAVPAGLSGCVDGRFATLSFFFDDKDSLRNMVGGQLVPKRMAIRWEVGNAVYRLRFSGESVDLGDGSGSHQMATVGFVCNAADASGCASWAVEPIYCSTATVTGGSYNAFSGCGANTLALLERESGPGASTAPVLIAVLDMPFAIQVDRR
jgi:hypothetical protein